MSVRGHAGHHYPSESTQELNNREFGLTGSQLALQGALVTELPHAGLSQKGLPPQGRTRSSYFMNNHPSSFTSGDFRVRFIASLHKQNYNH